MEAIDQVHKTVLETIDSEGALAGIPLYMKNKALYEALSLDTARIYWEDIFEAIRKNTR